MRPPLLRDCRAAALFFSQEPDGFAFFDVRSRQHLGLPEVVDQLTRLPNGLILLTGPTGTGKTTTMNYMVDLINRERLAKIIMIEDPIEHVRENRTSIVVQQEVHAGAPS